MSFPIPSRARRLIAVLFALTFVVAACGDDTSSEAGSTTTMADHGDSHDEPVDVSDLDPTPAVEVEVTKDPKAGWNMHFEATGHDLAPENASTDHVAGEGHAHLYIDGKKQTRLYTEDYFLGELEPGRHEIGVELSANDHRPLAVDGEIVVDTVTVEVPESDGDMGHDHGEAEPIDASGFDPVPSVAIEVVEDPKSGYNLFATFEGHEMAPQDVSTEPVEGEGHAHIYVDGEKLTRLYGEAYHLGDLEPGMREITVELSANDHRPLAVDGEIVTDTVMVDVAGTDEGDGAGDDHDHGDAHSGDTGDMPDASAADAVLDVGVAGGAVSGDSGRQTVAVGDTVLVRIDADVADEVHVHGYDLFANVMPGMPAEVQFTADIPGVFEIELEGSGLLLVELAVA